MTVKPRGLLLAELALQDKMQGIDRSGPRPRPRKKRSSDGSRSARTAKSVNG